MLCVGQEQSRRRNRAAGRQCSPTTVSNRIANRDCFAIRPHLRRPRAELSPGDACLKTEVDRSPAWALTKHPRFVRQALEVELYGRITRTKEAGMTRKASRLIFRSSVALLARYGRRILRSKHADRPSSAGRSPSCCRMLTRQRSRPCAGTVARGFEKRPPGRPAYRVIGLAFRPSLRRRPGAGAASVGFGRGGRNVLCSIRGRDDRARCRGHFREASARACGSRRCLLAGGAMLATPRRPACVLSAVNGDRWRLPVLAWTTTSREK